MSLAEWVAQVLCLHLDAYRYFGMSFCTLNCFGLSFCMVQVQLQQHVKPGFVQLILVGNCDAQATHWEASTPSTSRLASGSNSQMIIWVEIHRTGGQTLVLHLLTANSTCLVAMDQQACSQSPFILFWLDIQLFWLSSCLIAGFLNDLHRFDILKNSWLQLNFTRLSIPNDVLFCKSALNSPELSVFAVLRWSQANNADSLFSFFCDSAPSQRSSFGFAVAGDAIYVFGGLTSSGNREKETVYTS